MASAPLDAYGACLAQSTHLRTLAGMMARDDLPMASASGAMESGGWFALILVQGVWCEGLADVAARLAALIEDERARQKATSSKN